jgi:valine--pyruvate aminotransferase
MRFDLTRFGSRIVRPTGALELMTDLGEAAGTARGPTHMLGGGNPARIAEVEALYRRRLAEIAADGAQFGRFAAVYSAPSGEMAFRAELAAFLADRYGWRLTERNIALTAGSQAAFFAIYNLLAGDREEAAAGGSSCRSHRSTSATRTSASART